MKRKLLKKDFRFLSRLIYYSFKDKKIAVEIALEPCLNGFDVAVYKLGPRNITVTHPWLIRNKVCTNEKGYGGPGLVGGELLTGLLYPRRKKTWDHALGIANKFYTSIKTYTRLKKMGLLPQDGKAYYEDEPKLISLSHKKS